MTLSEVEEELFVCGLDIIVNVNSVSISIQDQLQVQEYCGTLRELKSEFYLTWAYLVEDID